MTTAVQALNKRKYCFSSSSRIAFIMQGNRERNSWALERVSENRCQKVGKPFVAEMFLGSKSHHCKSKEKSQKKREMTNSNLQFWSTLPLFLDASSFLMMCQQCNC